MKYFTFTPDGVKNCTVTAMLQTGLVNEMRNDKTYPAIVICPGGGYEFVSEREAEPVGRPYFNAGYHVFILTYAVGDHAKDFGPLKQAAATIAHVRAHAKEWRVEEDHVAICGFSAGGHLAASTGTLYNTPEFQAAWGREDNIRPDAMILSYPVITADEFAHTGSIEHVSGSPVGTEKYGFFGLDNHVDAATPPTFLWHTASDGCVPVENSLKMAMQLSKAKVPFEMHIFPEGNHGLSVCTDEVGSADPYVARWVELSIVWLNKTFSYQK